MSEPWFQPTLRLIGGGNYRVTPLRGDEIKFQPTLRLIGGGNGTSGRGW